VEFEVSEDCAGVGPSEIMQQLSKPELLLLKKGYARVAEVALVELIEVLDAGLDGDLEEFEMLGGQVVAAAGEGCSSNLGPFQRLCRPRP
jgi:hypothetical protein